MGSLYEWSKSIHPDDIDRVMQTVQVCLENLGGWEVLTAESGSEGLLKAETEKPDAILLDVMMPDLDGIALFQSLRSNPVTQSIPVILLTAKVQPANYVQYAQLGVAGVIAKPFEPLKLAEQVAEALGWS